MACFKNGTIIDLSPRETLSLPDMRGTTLRVTRGTVWITQQDDTKDIVLRAGDTWTVERNGLTLLEAQADTTFCVLGRKLESLAAPAVASALTLANARRHVYEAFAAFFTAPTRRTVPYF